MKTVDCSCCGKEISDTPEDNVARGQTPYPCDEGFGQCVACFGQPDAADVKKRIGKAGQAFFEARFPIVRNALNEERRASWDNLSYERKCNFIARMIHAGNMI